MTANFNIGSSQKENIPCRVTWSEHPVSSAPNIQPAHPSKTPIKSILKKPSHIRCKMSTPIPPCHKLPPNPLNAPNFLASPLNTILESTSDGFADISCHDLTDAYGTLSNRIRSQSWHLAQSSDHIVALNPLRMHRAPFLQALRRDIRRCLVDPYTDISHQFPPSEDYLLTERLEKSDQQIKLAQDFVLLCHHALRLLSDIFMHAALYSVFDPTDLNVLFEDLVAIARAPTLPTPNHRKTHSLCIWILQAQALPESLLTTKAPDILQVLKCTLACDSAEETIDIIVDGLKTIHLLLKRHPQTFLAPLSPLLPRVLRYLTSSITSARYQAVRALNGFALAKISSTVPMALETTISQHVTSFISSQSSNTKAVSAHIHLPALISASLAADASPDCPTWAVSVLASIVVLEDSALYSHPVSLKLIFSWLAQALAHNHSAVRALHPVVWKCLIWAFSRISNGLDTGLSLSLPRPDIEKCAFLVVKQEVRDGLGVALIGVVMSMSASADIDSGCDGSDYVSMTLSVLEEMTCSGSKSTRRQASELLAKLTGSIGVTDVAASWTGNDSSGLLAPALFDGELLSCTTRERLTTLIRKLGHADCGVSYVRQLTEGEMVRHWDRLVSVWIGALELSLEEECISTGDLITSWQSLLLVQAQLTQGLSHLTSPTDVSNKVVAILAGFLPSAHKQQDSLTDSTTSGHSRRFLLLRKLWNTLKHVFTIPWLARPAELVLAAVLEEDIDLEHLDIREAWSGLCSDLIPLFNAPSSFCLERLSAQIGDSCVAGMRRRLLWGLCAEVWPSNADGISWMDGVRFLAVPLKSWAMSNHELGLWKAVLRSTIDASCDTTGSTRVVEYLMQTVEVDNPVVSDLLTSTPILAPLLLSCINLKNTSDFPRTALRMVAQTLHRLYPPQDAEQLSLVLESFKLLRGIIRDADCRTVMDVLDALQPGVCTWIEDEDEILPDEEYNKTISSFYCGTVQILEAHPPSQDALTALAPFLTSAFVRIPAPAHGPIAFEQFWRTTYHARFLGKCGWVCPERIKLCLKALDDVYGGEMMGGISEETESHLSKSLVPDSQPSLARLPDISAYEIDQAQSACVSTATFATRATRPRRIVYAGASLFSHSDSESPNVASSSRAVHSTASKHLDYCTGLSKEGEPWSFTTTHVPQCPPTPHRRPRTPSKDPPVLTSPERKRRAASDSPEQRLKRRRTTPEPINQASRNFDPVESRAHAKLGRSESDPGLSSPPESKGFVPPVGALFDGVRLKSFAPTLIQQQRRPLSSRMQGASSYATMDYDTWDIRVSTPEVPRIQGELRSDYSDAATSTQGDSREPDLTLGMSDDSGILGSLGLAQSRRRSQTAPPLRLPLKISPLRRAKTTSANFDVLHQALMQVNTDGFQMPVEDLLRATKLVHQIGTVLNEKMTGKLRDPSPA